MVIDNFYASMAWKKQSWRHGIKFCAYYNKNSAVLLVWCFDTSNTLQHIEKKRKLWSRTSDRKQLLKCLCNYEQYYVIYYYTTPLSHRICSVGSYCQRSLEDKFNFSIRAAWRLCSLLKLDCIRFTRKPPLKAALLLCLRDAAGSNECKLRVSILTCCPLFAAHHSH